jgi:spore maturation protein CgeB
MAQYDLRDYDGVLAYGASIRDVYLRNKWSSNVWVWHEAADTRIFQPGGRDNSSLDRDASRNANHNGNGNSQDSEGGDVVWIGNWGDEERASEIEEFLIAPVRELGLKARVYGVRYLRCQSTCERGYRIRRLGS